MSIAERDNYSGHMTTGHEWNGIKELNTPVPKVLIAFLVAAFLFAIGYWVAMPAWPLGDSYTRGTLDFDQRDYLRRQLQQSAQEKSLWLQQIEQSDFNDIADAPELMQIVADSGPALFEDNCAMCHGSSGEGGKYFPRLNDAAWLWGSQPESILQTLTVGINSDHEDTRFALMPAFGDSGVLDEASIKAIALYLQSLSTAATDGPATAIQLTTGEEKYGLYCAGCHGVSGEGKSSLGGPRLNDDFWIYGSDLITLQATLRHGRRGHMPAWESRLSLADRKILSLYVLSLSEEPSP